ncbi:hypothetical protein GGR58DRAFT_506240 [Xylaria digitata]|nr:hypothetical protein GGR58DRAFT_506240 [Xylaria digitata]
MAYFEKTFEAKMAMLLLGGSATAALLLRSLLQGLREQSVGVKSDATVSTDYKKHKKINRPTTIPKSGSKPSDLFDLFDSGFDSDIEQPKWQQLKFSPDKQNYFLGLENWLIYQQNLNLFLKAIGYAIGLLISNYGKLILAQAVTNTCKAAPFNLVEGVKKGSEMLKIFGTTYGTSGQIY